MREPFWGRPKRTELRSYQVSSPAGSKLSSPSSGRRPTSELETIPSLFAIAPGSNSANLGGHVAPHSLQLSPVITPRQSRSTSRNNSPRHSPASSVLRVAASAFDSILVSADLPKPWSEEVTESTQDDSRAPSVARAGKSRPPLSSVSVPQSPSAEDSPRPDVRHKPSLPMTPGSKSLAHLGLDGCVRKAAPSNSHNPRLNRYK